MRTALLPAALVMALQAWALPARAQQPVPPAPTPPASAPPAAGTPVPVPSDPAAASSPAPLTTGSKPGDVPTTDARPVRPGGDGDAPSDEINLAPKDAPAPAPSPQPAPAPSGGGAEPGPMARPPLAGLTAGEAEHLLGRTVLSSDGESVGTVRDFLMVGPADSRIRTVVVGQGGILGFGEALVALPLEALALDHGVLAKEDAPVRLTLPAAELEGRERFRYGDRANAMVGPR